MSGFGTKAAIGGGASSLGWVLVCAQLGSLALHLAFLGLFARPWLPTSGAHSRPTAASAAVSVARTIDRQQAEVWLQAQAGSTEELPAAPGQVTDVLETPVPTELEIDSNLVPAPIGPLPSAPGQPWPSLPFGPQPLFVTPTPQDAAVSSTDLLPANLGAPAEKLAVPDITPVASKAAEGPADPPPSLAPLPTHAPTPGQATAPEAPADASPADPAPAPTPAPQPSEPPVPVPQPDFPEAATTGERPSEASTGAPRVVQFGEQELESMLLRGDLPIYPLSERRLRHSGVVHLRVGLDQSGAVQSLEVEHSSGHRRLDQAAVEAVRAWVFKPEALRAQGLGSAFSLPIRFQLRS